MRIVVVEDEVLVRKGILSGIPWTEHGIEVVGDAADGRTGLELIRRLKPDMVVTDIQMPIMDGLEMIRQVRKELPDTAILILSVREDFGAVREAIRLGVIDYVHKLTMSPEELLESVLQARNAKAGASSELAKRSEGDSETASAPGLPEWLSGERTSGEGSEFVPENRLYAVGIVRLPPGSDAGAARQLLAAAEESGLREAVLHAAVPDAVFVARANAADAEVDAEALAERWRTDLEAALRKLGPEGSRMSVGLGAVRRETAERSEAYREAREALTGRFYAGAGFAHLYSPEDERSETPEEAGGFAPTTALKAYLTALEQSDEELAARRFEELFPPLPPSRISPRAVRDRMLQWQSAVALLLGEWGYPLQGLWEQTSPFEQLNQLDIYEELREWCWRLHTVARELLEDCSHNGRRSEVEQAIRYMKENYRHPIRLQEVAAHVNLSDNYFSFLFSKSTGQPFVHYLHNLRVDKAKELLREGMLPWYEIGERVGFDNPKYFAKIFKRIAGTTPAQFQKSK